MLTKVSSLFFACFALALPVIAQEKASAPAESGMTTIFNGKDLSGWSGDPRLWTVRDGVIHGETTEENKANGNTFLIYQGGSHGDFELRLTFRCNAANNSGIQYRSKHITDKSARNEWVVRGYQHEIRNENKFPNVSGFIYDEGGKRGRVCAAGEKAKWTDAGKEHIADLMSEEKFQSIFKLNEWNEVIIIAKGNNVQHYMNGHLILDFTDESESKLLDGVIALQLHAGAPMWAEYKDIRIKKLSE